MNKAASKKSGGGNTEDLIKCSICADYSNSNEAFYCPRCRKGPLCKKHRLPGRKECLSCSFDSTLKEVNVLRGQEKSIKSFIGFLQFIFLVFSIFFIASKFGFLEEVPFLGENIVMQSIFYLGISTAVLLVLFYILMSNQKNKVDRIESELEKIGGRRYER